MNTVNIATAQTRLEAHFDITTCMSRLLKNRFKKNTTLTSKLSTLTSFRHRGSWPCRLLILSSVSTIRPMLRRPQYSIRVTYIIPI